MDYLTLDTAAKRDLIRAEMAGAERDHFICDLRGDEDGKKVNEGRLDRLNEQLDALPDDE